MATRVALILLLAPVFVLQVDGQVLEGRMEVHATEITADVRDASGRVPRDLQPADFVVLENGVPQKVIGVAYADAPPSPDKTAAHRDVVIFLQESLSTTQGLRMALGALAAEAASVTASGDVVVATDYPRPHSIFGPTHDAAVLRAFLEKLGGEITGKEELIRIRNSFAATDLPPDADDPLWITAASRKDQMLVRARKESTTLRAREDALLQWLSQYPKRTDGPLRTLLLVSDGFDLQSASFYRLAELRSLSAAPHHEELAHALAAEHWTIISLAMAAPPEALRPPAQFQSRIGGSLDEDVARAQKLRTKRVSRYPLAPLLRLADVTGGTVITDGKDVGAHLRDLSERVVITYQSDHPADATLRPVEITSKRPNVTVRAQRWAGTPGGRTVAEAIAASLATEDGNTNDDAMRGDLPVRCSITLGPVVKGARNSEITAHVDLKAIQELVDVDEAHSLDFTVAVVAGKEQPFTMTRRMENVDLAAADGYTCTIAIRHQQNARIAVVATEPSTGSWGTCTVR